MKEKEILATLRSWSLGAIGKIESIPSYWNGAISVTLVSGAKFVLKKAGQEHDLARERSLLDYLQASGIPVPTLVRAENGQFSIAAVEGTYILYTWLDGESADNHYAQGANNRAGLYGKAIGQLHKALALWPMGTAEQNLDLRAEIRRCNEIVKTQREGVFDIGRIESIADECSDELYRIQDQFSVQWIHRDLHPGNMLFSSAKLSGILDFDLIQKAPRIFDPYYCATSILISGWYKPQNRESWFSILQHLVAAYAERSKLSSTEKEAGYLVLCAIEYLFMAFAVGRKELNHARCNQSVLFWLHDNRSRIISELTMR